MANRKRDKRGGTKRAVPLFRFLGIRLDIKERPSVLGTTETENRPLPFWNAPWLRINLNWVREVDERVQRLRERANNMQMCQRREKGDWCYIIVHRCTKMVYGCYIDVTLMFMGTCDIIMMPNQIKGMAERSAKTIIRERSRVILFWEHGWTEKNVPVSREQRRQRIDPVSLRSILIALPLYMINSRDCTCAYL